MKRILAFALAGLSTCVLAQRAEPPVIRAGDEWKFVVYYTVPSTTPNRSWVITSVGAAGIQGTENGEPLLLSSELNILESTEIRASNMRMLSFPLEVGKKWHYESDWLFKPKASKGTFTSDVTVVAYEKIRVPAGEFDAFKLIEKRSMRAVAIDVETSLTSWYAPAASAIVKSVYTNPSLGSTLTTELVSFQRQR